MSDQKMHNGECYRACGCDPVAQARADERQRIVALLRKPFGPARADVAADWIERGMTAVDESEMTHE